VSQNHTNRLFIVTYFSGVQVFAAYRLLEMYVSPNGKLNATGTLNDHIPSLQEAQRRADEYIKTLDPSGIHKNERHHSTIFGTWYLCLRNPLVQLKL
jgi:hypothetical protein